MPLTIRECRMEECAQVLALWRSAEARPQVLILHYQCAAPGSPPLGPMVLYLWGQSSQYAALRVSPL